MSQPTVLCVILNYRTPELTLKAAAAALTAMEGIPGEVVIVDNDSGDGSFAQMSQAATSRGWTAGNRLRVISAGRNGGFGAGMNFGMRAGLSSGGTPAFYYLLNSDAFPEPGAIRHLRDFLIAHPTAGLAGSHVEGEDAKPHCTAFRFPSIAGEFETAARTGLISRALKHAVVPLPQPKGETQVDWTAGASLMLRAQMIEQIGGFDETFFLYFEETDLCLRAAREGWSCWYLPQSRVTHLGSASTGMKRWTRTPGYWFESRRHYFTKNHGHAYAAVATLARAAGQAIWLLRRFLERKPQTDPEHFLRDLFTYSFGKPATPAPARAVSAPLAEDRK
ncbi:glycosyltransferase family 2 protein [Antarcticimicrobium sediminis]|uniref:Glycosyltransferase family 2 protein n=1 Tax=Antarcticimicrobium sediminis TaxID=2546227 RepID=A0A4R5ELZ1_9RHOB|nr:glycosyltransferase family 2 protein [Antarcticimicrobium sediminis]TDE35588.1 glycosyltransferase family 2 protein [Antarcticimicrobium sediminis]